MRPIVLIRYDMRYKMSFHLTESDNDRSNDYRADSQLTKVELRRKDFDDEGRLISYTFVAQISETENFVHYL